MALCHIHVEKYFYHGLFRCHKCKFLHAFYVNVLVISSRSIYNFLPHIMNFFMLIFTISNWKVLLFDKEDKGICIARFSLVAEMLTKNKYRKKFFLIYQFCVQIAFVVDRSAAVAPPQIQLGCGDISKKLMACNTLIQKYQISV